MTDAEGNAEVEQLRSRLTEIRERAYAPASEAQMKRRPGRRLHYGLIAQEVKAALDAAGVDPMDAGFWTQSPAGEQALSYSELTIPLLRAVQELASEVAALKAERAADV
ncbi:MAG: tail fiber domain-containing protein [Gammaproteobacteria bacterium]